MSIDVSFRTADWVFVEVPEDRKFYVPNYALCRDDLSFSLSNFWPEEIYTIFTCHIDEMGEGKMSAAQVADAYVHVAVYVQAQEQLQRLDNHPMNTLRGLRDLLLYAKERGYCALIY